MPTSDSTPRREFLGQAALTAVALAAACTTPTTAAAPASPAPTPRQAPDPEETTPPPAPTTWDNSWFDRLTAKHKAVFEQFEIDNGSAPSYATRYLNGVHAALGKDAAAQTVVVFRHQAVPLVFNDAMWEKYAIGEERKLKAQGGAWATRNPVSMSRRANANASGEPQANVKWLIDNGHLVLGCDLAARNYSTIIAKRVNRDAKSIYAELAANILPGVIMQPNGVYATLRAQEAGCTYIRCP